MPADQQELFISYKRSPASTQLARALKAFVEQHFPHVQVMLDEKAIPTGASIKTYMDRLTRGHYIIFLLSPEFLESHWCMYELALTADYADFRERVFHVRFPGMAIGTALEVGRITQAWQQRWRDLGTMIAELEKGHPEHVAPEFREELRIAGEIVKGSGRALLHMRQTVGIEAAEDGGIDWEAMREYLKGWIKAVTPVAHVQAPVPTPVPAPEEAPAPSAKPKSKRKPKATPIQRLIEDMVFVEGGIFDMGSDKGQEDEQPIHTVKLKDFYIGKYPVTQAQWEEVMGVNPSHFEGCPDHPVEQVKMAHCKEFITRLRRLTGLKFRLPTEAEWEYAAGGGAVQPGFKYAGGTSLKDLGWYDKNSGNRTHPVGEKVSNSLDLFDMSGNVQELCQDYYDADYYGFAAHRIITNPKGPKEGTHHVTRGGSWAETTDSSRITFRGYLRWDADTNNVGLRLVMDV